MKLGVYQSSCHSIDDTGGFHNAIEMLCKFVISVCVKRIRGPSFALVDFR